MRVLLLSLVLFLVVSAKAQEPNVPVIVGQYELESSTNFVEYMKRVGVGIIMRNLAASATPVTTVSKDGDLWHMRTTTTFTTNDLTFKVGVPFRENTPDGRTCDSIVTLVGDHTFNHVQNCGNGLTGLVTTRDFTGDQLRMVLTIPAIDGAESVVCTRIYKKKPL